MAVTEELLDRPMVKSENASRVVWALAWPAVALNSLQVINTLLDRGFIGHLDAASLTAHGGSMNLMFLMFSLAMALATGATALVSRAFGAGDTGELRRSSQEALGLAVIVGIAIGLLTALVASSMASLVLPANDQEARRLMTRFCIAYSLGMPPIFVIQTLAGSLRGVGDTKSPMVISGIQILLHMTLNVILIFGAKMGLVGAGCALSISAWAAAIAYVLYLGKTPLGQLKLFRIPNREWAIRILRISVPAAVMSTLRVFSLTAFTLVLKQVPDASSAIAAMSIGFAIESIMFMPAFGLSVSAGALVGQSLGMKDPARAEKLAWTAGHYGALVTILLVTPIFLGAHSIALALVGGKEEIASQAATLIRALCLTEFLFAYAMVMLGAMQGAGDTVRPLWISVFSLWGIRVPLTMVLSLPIGFKLGGFLAMPITEGLGAMGAWIALSSTQGLQGILAMIFFKRGDWKFKKV